MSSIKGSTPTLSCRWLEEERSAQDCRGRLPALRSWWSGRHAIDQWPDFESPLAPAPCWWTRTIVPSMIAYSKSGSPKVLEDTFEYPLQGPSREALEGRVPVPPLVWKITPGRPDPRDPEHRGQKQPVIRRRPAWITKLARKKRRYSLPLRVDQNKPNQGHLHFRSLESKFPPRGNPPCKCQQALVWPTLIL
jgi:hypothetical protein